MPGEATLFNSGSSPHYLLAVAVAICEFLMSDFIF